MANRINGNVIIIDSAMGNNFALRSGTDDPQIKKVMVNAIAIYQMNTTGSIMITGADTTNAVFRSDWLGLTADSMGKVFVNNPSWFSFGQAQSFEDIKVPIVTAGTAFLYFV